MFLQSIFTALLLTGSFPAPPTLRAQDDGDIKLQFTAFDPGSKPFYQMVESSATLKLKREEGPGQEVKSCILIIHWTPQPAEGKYLVVKRRLVAVQQDNGNGYVLADATPREVTLLLDPESLKVTEIRGRKSAERLISQSEIREEFLGDEQLKDAARQPWFGAHRTSVKKGTAWREAIASEWPLPWWELFGSFEGVRELRCQRWDDGRATISVVPTLCYRPAMAAPQRPAQLQKGSYLETRDRDSRGTIVFDRAKGRAVESVYQATMHGVCTWKVSGVDEKSHNVDVELTQKVKFTTSDEMPKLPG